MLPVRAGYRGTADTDTHNEDSCVVERVKRRGARLAQLKGASKHSTDVQLWLVLFQSPPVCHTTIHRPGLFLVFSFPGFDG